MKKVCVVIGVILVVGIAGAKPIWKDPVAPGKQSVIIDGKDGTKLRIDVLSENLFRVRRAKDAIWTESGMNRYGVFKSDFAPVAFTQAGQTIRTKGAELTVSDAATGKLRLKSLLSPADVAIDPALVDRGFAIRFGLTKDERVYGLGDSSRKNVMRRGDRYNQWVLNRDAYIPIPMAMSRNGWGVLLNSTWRHAFDIGKKDPNAMICEAKEGDIDFYVFTGKDYRALLNIYTRLSGRSALLPVWGYGFVFVCNQFIDQFNLVNEGVRFREMNLPCDVLGLEPGWMEKFYDSTTRKQWNKSRFYFPYWAPKGNHTFVGALKRIGFKLSLWLCCDYDLTRYEEQLVAGKAKKMGRQVEIPKGITETWQDDRIGNLNAAVEKKTAVEKQYPEGTMPWFEHLKKFVDQGAACFKLDGCNQVGEHPNRKWDNGKTDEEVHNLYPLIYAKQMSRGFEDYTRRRSMVYSASGYAGLQQYVATWAGDTGGGIKPLVSILNLAYSGHSNQSCDMSIANIESLHFGFLQTWSQQNNWDYWYQPWLQRPEHIERFRNYLHLRYRLVPYLYTAAAEAALTGWPVMRSLSMDYPDDPIYDKCDGAYLLGDSMLASAFSQQIELPPGTWYDWRTDERVKGPCVRKVRISQNWGGSLYVKAGAIIPTWPLRQYLDKGWNEQVDFLVYPSAAGSFNLYEDNGIDLNYRKGAYARTLLTTKLDGNGNITFTAGARKGSYSGMPATRKFSAMFKLPARPKSATLDGMAVEGVWDAAKKLYTVSFGDCGAKEKVVRVTLK